MYNNINTAFDVMKEFLIQGCELDGKYQIPMIPVCNLDYLPEDSIDFEESFSRKIKNHRKLNVNFYIDDVKFTRLWNNPDKYLEHLKCFHSVTMPDFSISTGSSGMPFALNIYNKYRNHAIAWYLYMHDITVIPSVPIADKDSYDWCFDGEPVCGIVAVSSVGTQKNKESKRLFLRGYEEMMKRLSPEWVIFYGKVPEECDWNVIRVKPHYDEIVKRRKANEISVSAGSS